MAVKDRTTRDLKEKIGLARMVGQSRVFLDVMGKIPVIAHSEAGVLLRGETGTGKEVVARAIHYLSPRSAGPFVPVNCGAIPVDLVESELFGHERSAFTGAQQPRAGLIEEAGEGTLFLDEVDSLPPLAQAKLLRFLQDKEFRRLGSTRLRVSDVRVIAATNADVEAAVAGGKLRQDLYYRLNVIPLRLPALRDRREDIPLLADHFLKKLTGETGSRAVGFTEEALAALLHHDWPGNVRELEHVVHRAVVLCDGRAWIERGDFDLPSGRDAAIPESFHDAKAKAVARFEKGYLEQVLVVHRGNITRAAQAAAKDRRSFWELIRKHHIDASRFR